MNIELQRSNGSQGKRRKKRSTTPTCGASVSECCRERLFISFQDIGWDDWILSPSGFDAFYCRGSCTTATAALSSVSRHANILQVGSKVDFFSFFVLDFFFSSFQLSPDCYKFWELVEITQSRTVIKKFSLTKSMLIIIVELKHLFIFIIDN